MKSKVDEGLKDWAVGSDICGGWYIRGVLSNEVFKHSFCYQVGLKIFYYDAKMQ